MSSDHRSSIRFSEFLVTNTEFLVSWVLRARLQGTQSHLGPLQPPVLAQDNARRVVNRIERGSGKVRSQELGSDRRPGGFLGTLVPCQGPCKGPGAGLSPGWS